MNGGQESGAAHACYTHRIPVRSSASIAAALVILALEAVSPPGDRTRHRPAPLVCRLIALPGNSFTTVGVPAAARRDFLTGLPTATFQVTYVGFGGFPAAQAAFQAAVDIWSHLIVNPVPIKVRAEFAALGPNVLGSAGADSLWRNFPGAPLFNTWYVDALADHESGSDVNASMPAAFDIEANFNSSFSNWYFGTDGATPANQYDFVTVVLHELAHGLGFAGLASVNGNLGSVGFDGFPSIFDRFVVTETDAPLLGFPNPSVALGTQLTSGFNPANPRGPGAYWNGPLGRLANGDLSARLYTPNTWQQGSSYSHVDENTYPAGDPNSLMTYALAQAEAIHDPGPVVVGVFGDSGWIMSGAPVPGGAFSKISPANLTANQPTTLTLSWAASSGATAYEYCLDATSGSTCDTGWIPVGNNLTVTVSGLSVSTNYYWQVRAQNPAGVIEANGGTWWSFWTPTVIPLPFGKTSPANGAAGLPGNVTLAWGVSSNATEYRYCVDTSDDLICNSSWISTTATSVTIALLPGTTYYWQVEARAGSLTAEADADFYGSGSWWSFTTQAAPTRIIALSGGLGFGSTLIGKHPSRTLNIGNTGDAPLTVAGITYPGGFTGNWSSGVIAPGGAQEVIVTFSPTASTSYGGQITVQANHTSGTATIGASGIGTARLVTDLDGDGIGDVLLQERDSTYVGAWLMTSTGHASNFVFISPFDISALRIVGRLDLNADGVGDILLQDTNTGLVAAWRMNSVGQRVDFNIIHALDSATWKVVGTADLNSDSVADILVQDSVSTYVAALLMNSLGQPTNFVPVAFADLNGWRVVATADINADGITDIVLQDSTSTFVAAWQMNGSGQPVSFIPIAFAPLGTWRVVGSEDLNGDCIVDILLQDSDSTFAAAWLMNEFGQRMDFVIFHPANVGGWRVEGRQ